MKPSKRAGKANRRRRPRQSARLDSDPELNNSVDIPASSNDENNQPTPTLLSRPIASVINNDDIGIEPSVLLETGNVAQSERPCADDTILDAGAQTDLNDEDWQPPPQMVRAENATLSQYNLRPRENIIPPRREL